MKLLPIILFCICLYNSNAQVRTNKRMDSIKHLMTLNSYTTYADSAQTLPLTFIERISDKFIPDTVKCIMLIINPDTGIVSSMGFFHPLDQAQNDRRIPYWVIGYCFNLDKYKISWSYLDENKKQMPKNIIVCMSYNIPQ